MMARPPPRKEDYKKLGTNAFKDREYIKGLGYFSLAHENSPNDVQILQWKVKCYYELKQAQICLKYVNNSDISSAGMMVIESKIYLDRHDFAKIAECSRRLSNMENESKLKNIIEEMKSISTQYSKYMDLKSKQQYKLATQSINQLIGKLPFNKNTIKLRIEQLECLLKCGELDRAKVIFESLDQQSQTSASLFCLRLKLYYYLRDEAKYKQMVQKGQSLFAWSENFRSLESIIDETDFILKQGRLLLQYKKYADALKTFTDGIAIDPYNKLVNAIFHFNKAIVYRKIGVKDEAQANFNKSIELNQYDINVHKEKAQFSIQIKDYVAAILQYEKLLEIDPNNSQYYQKEIHSLKKLDKKNGKGDYYQILNVKKGSQEDQIKRAYKFLALKYHPDRNRNKSGAEIAESSYIFMEITQAYKALMDPKLRKSYDSSLTSNQDESSEQEQGSQEGNEEKQTASKGRSSPKQKTGEQNNYSRDSRVSSSSSSSSPRQRSREKRRQDSPSPSPQNKNNFKNNRNYQQQKSTYERYNQHQNPDKAAYRNSQKSPYNRNSYYDRRNSFGSRDRTR